MIDFTSVPELAATASLGLLGLAFGIQRLIKQWHTVSTENSILGLMHTELERLAKQNGLLTAELSKLQLEILALNKELRTLSSENQRLHIEMTVLTNEVTRLQSVITKHGGY